ncbi:MAG TPA: HPF/RaiA family ribosome-associated protein [Polyangiaceae bacterium]|nr:HPF/RaiA family ribosome-associated protein [Polyangiaceae bacterium]
MPKFELRSQSLPVSEALREHVARRLDFALRRFARRVDGVVVRLVDLNGPKGGPDKRCRIVARLEPAQSLVVEATDPDLYVAVSQAALRLDGQVARALTRRAPKGERGARRPTAAARAPAAPAGEGPGAARRGRPGARGE